MSRNILLAFGLSAASAVRAEEPAVLINMDDAVRVGVANHFALEAVQGRRSAAEKMISERWRAYLPSVGIGYNRTHDIAKDAQDNVAHEVRLTIEQVLYDGGKRSLELDVAKLDALLAREDFRITYNKLQLDIQQAYLTGLAAVGKVQLNQKSLERSLIQLRQARREYQLGFGTHLQVLTVASRTQEIELALRKSVNEYKQSIYDLKLAMNVPADANIRLRGNLFTDFELRPPNVDVQAVLGRAMADRPELLRSRVDLHRKKKELDIAEAYWVPRFKVGTYVGRRGEDFPIRERTWGVTFGFTFPLGGNTTTNDNSFGQRADRTVDTAGNQNQIRILDDLSFSRRIMESRIALGQSAADEQKTRREIQIEVNRAYTSLKEAWEQIHIGNGRVYFQYESTRLMTTRHQTGEVKRSEIVFAEAELVKAQGDLTDAMAGYMKAALQLEFAGGLAPRELRLFNTGNTRSNTLLALMASGRTIKPAADKNRKQREKETKVDDEMLDRINKSLDDSKQVQPPARQP